MSNLKTRACRVAVAVAFGLIGFGLNFLDIEFMEGTTFRISILAGLFFPLVVALAWGWHYGLLSALSGGCQTMWWLWHGDGWGVLYSVPVFTLWVVWHGLWAQRDTSVIYAGAALFGFLLWALDALVDYFVLPREGQTFWGIAVHGASAHEVFMRSVYVAVAMLAGIVLVRLNRRRAGLSLRLEHAERVFGWISLSCSGKFARSAEEHDLLKEVAGYESERLTADGQRIPVEMWVKCRFNATRTFLGLDKNFHENQTCINRA